MLRISTLLSIVIVCALAIAPRCNAQSIVEDLQYRSEINIDPVSGDTIQTFYYQNGVKRSEGRLVNGLREAQWTLWYGNERIWMIGDYHQSQMDGKWRFWDDGLIVKTYTVEGKLLEGARQGHWVYFYPNGNVMTEGDWERDVRTGTWTYRYEGNQLKRIENWANGVKNGKWEFWHVNGQQEREETYNGDVKHGTWTYWYDNGNLERKENWQGGRKHGLWTFWFKSGQIEMQGTFVNDVALGEWTVWYENGEKKMEGNLQANAMEDEWIYWYPNSNKKAKVTYARGDIINVRLLRKPPVNYDRRPEVISSGPSIGNYSRERMGQNAGQAGVPQGETAPTRAFDGGVADPLPTQKLAPNNSQNTPRVSGFQQSTGSAVIGKEPGK